MRSLRAALRSDVSSSHPVLRGLVGILTVISLIAGILAMHALGVESLGSVGAEPAIAQPAVASVADASHTSPGAAALSGFGGCDSAECGPTHSITIVLCILALLLTWALFLAALDRTRWRELITLIAHPSRLLKAVRDRLEADTPSLTVLSISRTAAGLASTTRARLRVDVSALGRARGSSFLGY